MPISREEQGGAEEIEKQAYMAYKSRLNIIAEDF